MLLILDFYFSSTYFENLYPRKEPFGYSLIEVRKSIESKFMNTQQACDTNLLRQIATAAAMFRGQALNEGLYW